MSVTKNKVQGTVAQTEVIQSQQRDGAVNTSAPGVDVYTVCGIEGSANGYDKKTEG